MLKKLALILVFYSSIEQITTGLQKQWTFELIEIDIVKTDQELLDAHFEIVRLGRGKLGINGFADIKMDLYDNVTIEATIEKSKYRAGPYILTPMAIQNMKLSVFMNRFYKQVVQSVLEKCSENAPIIKDQFVQPLTRRYVKFCECEFDTDNMPNIMMEGYYRTKVYFKGAARLMINVLVIVESEIS